MSAYEKERLELVFTINSGCTDIFGQIKDLFVALKELLVDMTPKQKLAVMGMFFVTIIGIYGATMLKDYYVEKGKNQTSIALQKDENATKVALEKEKTEQLKSTQENMLKSFEAGVDSQKTSSSVAPTSTAKTHVKAELPPHAHENYFKIITPISQETHDIIERVKQEYPVAARVSITLNKGVEKLIHSTRQADLVKYNNTIAMSGDVARTISFESRAKSDILILNDKFRVLDLDSKRTDIRKTRLRNSDGVEFTAEFTDGSIGKEKMDKLLQAFKGYHPIELSIEAKEIRNKIHSAFIKQVREVDTTFSFKDDEENA